MKHLLFISLLFLAHLAASQRYTNTSIFSHNDYAGSTPFFAAYNLNVGYIEADAFLRGTKLLVAHSLNELDESRTLESLYLAPLSKEIKKNSGYAYADRSKPLMLMIDLKSEGTSTLNAIVTLFKNYPQLISCKNLTIMISGDMPAPESWNNFPEYIHFDGRPGIDYTEIQLKRIAMVSTSFNSISDWNGLTELLPKQKESIESFIKKYHDKGKPVRFWATPDNENSWKQQMTLGFDVIVTDKPKALATFIASAK